MMIFAINEFNIRPLKFEGKKDKAIQKSVHSSSPIKAIPLAALIAMSPLNATMTNAQQTNKTPRTELLKNNEKVLLSEVVNEAFPNGTSCRVDAISTDGNDSDFEFIRLVKTEQTKYGLKETMIYPARLDTYYITDSYSGSLIESGFCVYGKGIIKDINGTKESDNEMFVISENLYNNLKDLLGSSVEYTESTQSW